MLMSTLGPLFSEGAREERGGPLLPRASDDVFISLMLLPTMWADLRAEVSKEVLVTDASPSGGGACVSTGLSPAGVRFLANLRDGDDASQRGDLLVVSTFDGMGWALQVLDLLEYVPAGRVAHGMVA